MALERSKWGTPTYSKEFYGKRSESWPKALEWAQQKFRLEFAPSPFGGYLPVAVLKRLKEFAKKEV